MTRIEELEEKRAKAKVELDKAEAEQYEKDLESLIELEAEYDGIRAVRVKFRQGFPTRAFLRSPTRFEYVRYQDQVHKAVAKKNEKATAEAQNLLAKSVWVYPRDPKERDAMLEAFPGLLVSIALAASRLAEGTAEEEGKD